MTGNHSRYHLVGIGALRHVRHVEVAVVVVTDVLLVQAGDVVRRSLHRVGLAHVPVRHELHAIRVNQRAQNDIVVQDPQRLGIGPRIEAIDGFDELLGPEHLGRMQAAINPDDGFPVPGELSRCLVGQPFGQGKPAVEFLELGELLVVFRRRDDRGQLGTALLRLSNLDNGHAVRFPGQLADVRDVLRVIGEEVVVADIVTEMFFRARNRLRRRPGRLRHQRPRADRDQQCQQRHDDDATRLQFCQFQGHENLIKG